MDKPGCRIKSGMTAVKAFTCQDNNIVILTIEWQVL